MKKKKLLKMGSGYAVRVKRGEKWVRVGRILSREQAFGLGSRIATGTPRASFRVERVNARIPEVRDPTWARVRGMFRPPARKSRLGAGVFVEKTRHRIDMPGEVRGISWKGASTSRLLGLRGRKKKKRHVRRLFEWL